MHRLRAVGHARTREPLLGHFPKGLGGGQPALLALLFQCGRRALGDGFLRVDQLFASECQRNASGFVVADGQRFAAAVETVIVAEDNGTDGRYRHVRPVSVQTLVNLGLRLDCAVRCR